jgi:hypothetical protein
MLLIVLACIGRFGRNIPLAEDWLAVPALTGNEPSLAAWLWEQNNEHRTVLPKLVLLSALKLTGGDFRAGMVVNALLASAIALAMILAARRIRGGRTVYTDAFFPVALLHLGHWENLIWSWQLVFVISTALICVLLLVAVTQERLPSPRAGIAAGVCLVLLPLSSANGVIFALLLAPWLAADGLLLLRGTGARSADRRLGAFLVGAAAAAVLITGVYFVGYQRATWFPPSPSIRATLETSLKVLALGFGPAAKRSWPASSLAAAVLLSAAGALLLVRAWQGRGAERMRALRLLLFAGAFLTLALAVGWGRAGSVPTWGLPARYALLSAPALALVYFVWELYGPPALRGWVRAGLLAVMCIALPFNTQAGLQWGRWYRNGMTTVERDLVAGTPLPEMARRHRAFLLHWNEEMLASRMQMLSEAGIGPFRHYREGP